MPAVDISSVQAPPTQHLNTEIKVILAFVIILLVLTALGLVGFYYVFRNHLSLLSRLHANIDEKFAILDAIDQKLKLVEEASQKIEMIARESPKPGLRYQPIERLDAGSVTKVDISRRTSDVKKPKGRELRVDTTDPWNPFGQAPRRKSLSVTGTSKTDGAGYQAPRLATLLTTFSNNESFLNISWPFQGDGSDLQSSPGSDNSSSVVFRNGKLPFSIRAGSERAVGVKAHIHDKYPRKGVYQSL